MNHLTTEEIINRIKMLNQDCDFAYDTITTSLNKIEEMEVIEVDTDSDMDRPTTSWPDSSDRINNIGQNGSTGEHYNYDKCVRYPDEESI